ncbi:MAG: hypothetical protein EOP58_02220 [Sphingomonadales bacterium]|nr:MAG: hypothetical protein EOP58_02220 [Sphingomonadales bacterium]
MIKSQAAAVHYDYELSLLHIRSEIELPELPPWRGDGLEPDVTIGFGPVPATVADPKLVTTVLQIGGDGTARFHLKDVATYFIEGGRRITIDAEMPRDAPDIRLFLLGTVYGVLCHQRGLLPVHAAGVELDGRAVLLAGPSGVGKSTLAAAFWRRGFKLLSDDLTPLRLNEGTVSALAGFRRVRLWRDSVDQFDWADEQLEPCRAKLEKFSRPIVSAFATDPLKPSALFHLQRHAESAGGARLRPLRGGEATQWLGRNIYRSGAMIGLYDEVAAMLRLSQAAAGIPRHFLLSRPMRYDDLDTIIDQIVDAVRGHA